MTVTPGVAVDGVAVDRAAPLRGTYYAREPPEVRRRAWLVHPELDYRTVIGSGIKIA
jgi:hypothetical protein